MAPPTYTDLGKAARDVFGKGYHFGQIKLDVKGKTNSGMEISSGGVSNHQSGKVTGNLELKQCLCDHGGKVNLTNKWTTDNILNSSFEVQDQLMKGLKLSLESTLTPTTGAKNGLLKAELKTSRATVTADTDLNLSGPILNSSCVVGHLGWLAGVQLAYDTNKGKLVKNNLSLGYSSGDLVLHSNVNDGTIFGASMYQKVKPGVETGVNLGWTASSNTTSFGVGLKFLLDDTASIRAKVNNSSQIGLGYQQQLTKGLNLTLSTLIDGKNFNQGGHKVGLCLELES